MRSRTILLLASLLLSACASLQPAARFKILQINDVYKIEGLEGGKAGGLARVRTLREQLESDGSAVLVLHAGDAIYPSVMSKYLDGQAMIDVMNLLDGDAEELDPALIVGLGNHELDNKDQTVLLHRLRESRFQWLATNTLHCNPSCGRFPQVPETLIRDIDGVRVGLFALLYDPLDRGYARTTPTVDAAREAVRTLRRQGARVIVAITHQDMPKDRELVREVPEIDLVIGGHDHVFLQDRVGKTWITKADADAKSVIVYDVTVARGEVRTAPLRVVIDETIEKDAAVDRRVQYWLGELEKKLGGNETIGTTENLLEGVEPAIRGRETALGNLIADAIREQMGADVGIINGGSIRINDNIPPGPITRYDMEGIFYYKNGIVAFPVTGRQLLDLLSTSVMEADSADGRFLQVSGLRFAYQKRGEQFVVDAADVLVGDRPLDLDATYTVATSDFLYLRGTEDDYTLFAEGTRPAKVNADREADLRTTVEDYIRKRGRVETEIEGRIVRK